VRSLLDLLGLADRTPAGDAGTAETATVRKIARELEELEPERARFLAAFAYLLSRVAHADLEISDEETRSMEEIVRGYGDLPDAQAVLVVEIAKSQSRLFGHTENFQVAREFKKLADREQCLELLHCLFAVSAADDVISGVEERQVQLIAEELGFSHKEFIDVRSQYNEKRSVIRGLRNQSA